MNFGMHVEMQTCERCTLAANQAIRIYQSDYLACVFIQDFSPLLYCKISALIVTFNKCHNDTMHSHSFSALQHD